MLLIAGAGCGTTGGPASASFASVTIQNHTPDKIAAIAAQVFGAEWYACSRMKSGELVFEKPASRGTSFAREGLVARFYGAQTVNWVRLNTVPLAGGQYRLEAKAYLVTGGSDPFFKDEVPLANMRKGPYQSLARANRSISFFCQC